MKGVSRKAFKGEFQMKKKTKTMSYSFKGLLLMVSLLFLFACTQEGNTDPNNQNDPNNNASNNNNHDNSDELSALEEGPVTISIGWGQGDEHWESFVADLNDEFPNVTLERVDGQPFDNKEHLEEWILNEEIPDIVALTTNNYELFAELELAFDMSDLIEKYNYDLDRFIERNMDHVRMFSINNGIQGLPYQSPRNIMFYNKDIFDAFGEDYPEAGQGWDEIIDIARKLTGERDGIEFRGLDIGGYHLGQFMTLDTPVLDPDTDEVQISSNPIWRTALEQVEAIYSIPGNYTGEGHFDWNANWDAFVGDQVVAMTIHPFSVGNFDGTDLENWGVTTIPEYDDYPGIPGGGAWTYGISSTAENKEATFEVLRYLLSDEQLINYYSAFGDVSRFPLSDASLIDQVDADPIFENVDLDILFSQEFAKPIPRSAYETEMPRSEVFIDLVESGEDINTHMRIAEEDLSSLLAELKSRN